eukprot:1152182-Pelagomonas_calceolata.AAC.14
MHMWSDLPEACQAKVASSGFVYRTGLKVLQELKKSCMKRCIRRNTKDSGLCKIFEVVDIM